MPNGSAGQTLAACFFGCLLAIIVLGLLAGITGWLFMLLWNCVIPGIFPAMHAITFWQALGLWTLLYMAGAAFFATVKKIQGND